MPKETQADQKKNESASVIPEKSPFSGDAMDKFAEQIGLFDDEPTSSPKEKQQALKETKPCEDCPDSDGETPTAEMVEKKTSPEKTTSPKKPFKILKDPAGNEITVYSQQELDDLALKGATGQRQSKAELKAKEIEERLANAMSQLERIESFSRGEAPKEEQKTQEEQIDLDTIDDPAVKNTIKTLREQVNDLKKAADLNVNSVKETKLKEVASALDEVFVNARNESPFEDIRFEEKGPNFSEELFSGLMQQKVSKDRLTKGQLRGIDQYIKESVADLSKVEKYYKQKFSKNGQEEITAETVISKYPEIAEEIGQRAIANWQKKLEEAPPVAKSRSEDLLHGRGIVGEPKKFKGLDDALNQAFSNPEIAEALEQAKKRTQGF